MKFSSAISVLILSVLSTGCATLGKLANPFYSEPSAAAYYGEKNDRALNESSGGGDKGSKARMALEQFATYQRAHAPQPGAPVMYPAVVRLMWIPDHLNSHGDLVPAHYYYLRVLRERPGVTDAFELEAQLNTGPVSSGIGYVQPEDIQ
jgi:hypothetical protein